MELKKTGEDIIKSALRYGADEAEAVIENVKEFSVNVRKGEVETLQKSVSKGLGLRVYLNKALGFSYTSDLSPESLDETVKRTVDLAKITESKPWQGLPDFGPQPLTDLDLYDAEIAAVPDEKKIAMAREVERIAMAQDKRITNSEGGSFNNSEREAGLFNSRGISYVLKETSCGFNTYVIAGEGDNMQGGGWSSNKRFFKELAPVEDVARRAAQRAVEMLGAKPVETKKVPVIFDRYATSGFWMGILFALDGDEVFRKTTFMTEMLDKPIASPLITVYDDPTRPRFVGSVPFDGEGNVTRRVTLIDKGVLKTFYYDSQTARKAGVKVHTMARSYGYKGGASAGFLCVTVENGKDDPAALFKDIKEGLLVTGMRGSGTDSTTGSFSVGCSGFWIVDGAKAFPVDGVTLGGTTLEILNGIDKVANDLDMRGSLNSPSFRVAEITVGGKKA
ncbi:MAG: microcin-processing peptidase 1 [Candidatus Aminicenantes bacterium]|jgi:PmbA protein|nr:microcin-processing peptidase 1 [Candidatus Aminicenantes bacterium]